MKEELTQPTEEGQVLPQHAKLTKQAKCDFIAVVGGKIFNGGHLIDEENPINELDKELIEDFSSDPWNPFDDLEP